MNAETIKATLPRDLMASVVVLLVALPLCMGIAIASGLPPAKGVITGIVGGLVVAAGAYLFRAGWRTWFDGGCGSGCGRCATPADEKPGRVRLL